jgi:hypothetical protein
MYRLPDGEPLPPGFSLLPGYGQRMDVVKARGFHEFEDDEWRAAALLDCLEWVRSSMKRGDTEGALIYAVRAGALLREAQIKELFAEDAKNRGKVPEPDPVVTRWVASRLRANPGLKLADLNSELQESDAWEDAIRIGRAKVYRSGRAITVFENNTERKLALTSLRRYLTKAREKHKAR